MSEVKTEVRTFNVEYVCDSCNQANMRSTGIVLTSNPPWYPHKCPNCGACQDFRTSYPKFVTEKVKVD